MPVIKNLQEDVEYVRMSLLDLVQEHDAIGLAAHPLAELSALLVTNVAGRRSDEAGDREFLHIFAHVDPDHILL